MEGRLPHDTIETQIGSLDSIDHRGVAWAKVRKTAYLIHQRLHYTYPGEIHDLRQRLMIVPPERYGGQRLVTYKLEVSVPAYEIERSRDAFGNRILNLFIEHVEREIEFTAWIVVERDAAGDPVIVPGPERSVLPAQRAPAPRRSRFLEPTMLTMPDDALRAAATALQGEERDGLALAERINLWVHRAMSYAYGVTDVGTPAADALTVGTGVCQDYAHIMLVLCRLCGLPARYISGHLLGEGGTHAWVEVLLPDPSDITRLVAHPFDPTNGCIPGLKYITVAVGRDYGDVAPTSGTFRAPYVGSLSAHKRADITALEYFPGKN
jgi:transglutaminase-like putative cysteine protease